MEQEIAELSENQKELLRIDPSDLDRLAAAIQRSSELVQRVAASVARIEAGEIDAREEWIHGLRAATENNAELLRRLTLFRMLIAQQMARLSQEEAMLKALAATGNQTSGSIFDTSA
jgi:hypothetical protein